MKKNICLLLHLDERQWKQNVLYFDESTSECKRAGATKVEKCKMVNDHYYCTKV
jgi:hypothetical protein